MANTPASPTAIKMATITGQEAHRLPTIDDGAGLSCLVRGDAAGWRFILDAAPDLRVVKALQDVL
jgi:hypothetical protein